MAILILLFALLGCLDCSAQVSRKSQWFHGPPKSSFVVPACTNTGFLYWYRADQGISNTVDGSIIFTPWTNSACTHQGDLTQPINSPQTNTAIYRTVGGPNGYPYVTIPSHANTTFDVGFRVTDDPGTNHYQPNYIFAVFQQTNRAALGVLFDGTTDFGNIHPHQNQNYIASGLGIGGLGYLYAGQAEMIYGGWPTTNWALYEATFNGTNTTLLYNGTALPLGGGNLSPGSQDLASPNVMETALNIQPVLQGNLAELMVYGSNVAPSDVLTAHNYLMSKYALTTNAIYNPTFDPARDVSGLIYWMDASNGVNTTIANLNATPVSGDSVTNWFAARTAAFSPGPAPYLSNTVSAGTPIYYSSGGGPSGANRAHIGMTNTYMPLNLSSGLVVNQPITYCVVCKNTINGGAAMVGDGDNAIIVRKAGNAFDIFGGADLNSGTGSWPAGDTNYYYIVAVFDGASSLIRTNGVQAASGNAGTSTWNGSTPFIGAQAGGTTRMNGDILRIAAWKGRASAQQITNIENWCINDFGFPAHP